MPPLLKCRNLVPVLGLSLEPLLGRLDLSEAVGNPDRRVDWVIVGCEKLRNRKPGRFHEGYIEAARDAIRQCREAGVPVFHKQAPAGGLVSSTPADWPADLRKCREWPTG